MEQSKTKKRPPIGCTLVLSYLATLLLVALAGVSVLLMTLCNPGYFNREVEKSGFAENAYELLCDKYSGYAASTGFDTAVLTDQISAAQISADMQSALTKMYSGEISFDKRYEVSNDIYDAMKADLAARGVEITDTVKTDIAPVADACRSDYANYVSVPMADRIYAGLTKVNKLLWPVLAGVAAVTVLLLLLTLFLAPDRRSGVRGLVFALLSAAGLCLVVALAVYPALNLSGFILNPASLRLLLLRYIQDLFGSFGIFALGYAVLAALLLVWETSARKKENRPAAV